MSEILPFNFESTEVRLVIIDNEPWWVGKDVCDVLGYTNHNKAIGDHCKGVTKRYPLQTSGGTQEIRIIAEPDLLRLIIGSRLPSAVAFERWIFEDVLPTIRKTGGYQVAAALPNFSDPVAAARAWADEVEAKQAALKTIEENRPKVEFFDQVTSSTDAFDMSEAAKVLNIGIGRTKLFRFLRDQGILMRDNIPYQEMIQRGYFRVIEQRYIKANGSPGVRPKTIVYQKGLDFILKRYKERNVND